MKIPNTKIWNYAFFQIVGSNLTTKLGLPEKKHTIFFCPDKGQLISKFPFGAIVSTKKPTIVFPHIVAAATILCLKLGCSNYSREETIQRRKLLISCFFCHHKNLI
jgi:hypothetical protein